MAKKKKFFNTKVKSKRKQMTKWIIIGSISLVIVAILSAPFLEWKAYVLKNLYEINTNEKNK